MTFPRWHLNKAREGGSRVQRVGEDHVSVVSPFLRCGAQKPPDGRAWPATWTLYFCLLLTACPMTSSAIQEPDYQVIQKLAGMELRHYSAYSVAQVVVPGPAADAGRQAFPILAAYIFGKNKGQRTFAMTAPVTQSAEPVKLPMTAPVTQVAVSEGFRVQFVLPPGLTAAQAPEPLDARVQLRDILPSQFAVIRYSGFWSEANDHQHWVKLQAALRDANLHGHGEPIYARYNAPFTPWFLRRNEIWLSINPVAESEGHPSQPAQGSSTH